MLRIFMVLSCILIVSAQADASDHGFYTGLGYGVAFYKNKTESGYLMPSNSNQHDHSENYFELYAGYSFNKYFSLEFGYADFPVFHDEYSLNPNNIFYFPRIKDVDMCEFSLRAILEYPLSKRISLLGTIGSSLYNMDVSWSGSQIYSDYDPNYSYSEYQKDFFSYGLGCKYDLANNITSRLKWSSSGTNDFDISTFSLSVEMNF